MNRRIICAEEVVGEFDMEYAILEESSIIRAGPGLSIEKVWWEDN